MMRLLRKLVVCAVLTAAVFTPVNSEAAIITAAGDTFNFSWSFDCGAAGTCTGTADFLVTSFSATQLGLQVDIDNTTDTSFALFLTSIGFNLSPEATSIDSFTPGSFLDNARLEVNFPSAGGTPLNLCVEDNSPPAAASCGAQNPNNGIPSPGTDTFALLLGGDFGTSVTLTDFFVQYMGEPDSFQGPGNGGGGGGGGGQTIPEPATLSLFGLAILGAANRMRRRTS